MSILHPQARLLPGLGVRLGRHPRIAAATLTALRRAPTRRLRAFAYRRVAQPLVERMVAELPIRAEGGIRMIADLPDTNGRALAVTGVWEWNVGAAILRSLRPGDVFVDVGANAGYYTMLAARAVGDTGHVYALEPAPRTFLKLERNLRLNPIDNVTAIPVAAGATAGEATLYGPPGGHDPSSSLRVRHDNAIASRVTVKPLHDVVAAKHRERLKLIKIDVEGHEDDVLRGLEPLLGGGGARPTLIVEVHALYNPTAPAFVVDYCVRHRLRAEWLVEDEGIDDDLAPVDRRLLERDLGQPPDLASLPRSRYALLLTPMAASTLGPRDPGPSPTVRMHDVSTTDGNSAPGPVG